MAVDFFSTFRIYIACMVWYKGVPFICMFYFPIKKCSIFISAIPAVGAAGVCDLTAPNCFPVRVGQIASCEWNY